MLYLDWWLGTSDNSLTNDIKNISLPEITSENSRVLVVDDNADMRTYIVKLIKKFYIVDEAGDGIEALEKVKENPPDLILTDIMMHRMDGLELLQSLRKDPQTSMIPIVFLSARAGEDTKVEGLHMGADDYLVKPFTGNEMLPINRSLELK